MQLQTENRLGPTGLPAQRIDATGRAHIDLRAVLALAAPLMANSAIQMLLNLTDTWFIGRLSTQAVLRGIKSCRP